MSRPESLVLLNPTARSGAAERLWRDVEPEVALHTRPRVVRSDPDGDCLDAVRDAVGNGVHVFVAAGGDGTVHTLTNALYRAAADFSIGGTPFTLAAVGLGSSNDFHKPFRRRIKSVPLRSDPAVTRLQDVGVAHYLDDRGLGRQRVFLISASVGMTAEANAAFNAPGPLTRSLGKHSAALGIACAALDTLARFRNFQVTLAVGGERPFVRRVELTNLGIMKTPFLSGWMRFDTPVAPDDGLFAINLCVGLTRAQALAVMVDLSRGRFLASGRAGTHHFRAPSLTVEAARPFALELDGEILHTKRVGFELLPRSLRCCT